MDNQTTQTLDKYAQDKYKYGFVTDIDSDRPKKGLNEETIKFISEKKNEPSWMLSWRIASYKKWLKMKSPQWSNLKFPKIQTKEDYVLWLKVLKKILYIRGINKNLTNYRKRKDSLSSNILTSIINGFKVYKDYMKMGYIESNYRLILLSINFLKKKITHDIFN